ARITGEGLAIDAEGDLEAARAELTLEPSLAATLVPAAAALTASVSEPVSAVALWRSGTGWGLTAEAQAEAEQATVGLELTLAGEGATYSGVLDAYLPTAAPAASSPIATASVAGTGGDL